MRWELTFLPFLFQLTLGLGSPVAWHTNETTPPETPIWSTGTLVNRGGTAERTDKGGKTLRRGQAPSHGAVEENLKGRHISEIHFHPTAGAPGATLGTIRPATLFVRKLS